MTGTPVVRTKERTELLFQGMVGTTVDAEAHIRAEDFSSPVEA